MVVTKKIYQNHRDNQFERILEAAEKLFIQNGIDNVSMGAIADAARLARKTLYEYFPNKQEIAWAIMENFLDERTTHLTIPEIPEGTGFKRLEFFVMHIVSLLDSFPEHIRFIVEFDTLYAREGVPSRLRDLFGRGGNTLIPMIRQGIADGSVRPDVDPEFLSAAILNLVSGMNSRFALLGKQISEEFGQSGIELYRGIIRIFLCGIQSAPSIDNSG